MDRQLGNYILHERLGVGGMGEVYRATKRGPEGFTVQVALKIILPHLAQEEAFRKRFSREARLAASLKHPGIVQVHGFDVVDGTPFIEMEFLPGADLRKILRHTSQEEGLSPEESVIILHSVARGLAHAHGHRDGSTSGGIIHCDLNPHNILISTQGEVKVADFGIARAVSGDTAASATVRGKLAYMSPEQIRGGELDHRTDLFSLGVIAYQLLSGIHPFERASQGGTVEAVGKAQHLPLSEAVPGLPRELCDLVNRLLEPDPASRPQSAGSVARLLEPLLDPQAATSLAARVRSIRSHTGHVPGTDSATAPTMEPKKSRRPGPFLAACAAGLALAWAVSLPLGGSKPDPAAPTGPEGPRAAVEKGTPVEAVPAAAPRTITLLSEPGGAEILADGIPVGRTPVVIRSDPDGSPLELQARLFGYRTRNFRPAADNNGRFLVTLDPLPTGTVQIGARPWARVTYRGEDMGETPLRIPGVPVGRRAFLLTCDPLEAQKEVVVEVEEGLNTVSLDMTEQRTRN